MAGTQALNAEEDWQVVLRFLPEGWQNKAKELGALRRCRRFAGAEALLRTLLIHLADGCSLRETAVRASAGGIAVVSDVALLKRLRASGEWLRWMAAGVMETWVEKRPAVLLESGRQWRVVDGSTISEPGATGSTWRLHYSICLPSLRCDEVRLTAPSVGESLRRFTARPGDVLIADRGFAHRAGVDHVVAGGGDVVVRINLTNLPLLSGTGEAFPLLDRLRGLKATREGDWEVWVAYDGRRIGGRVCALRKSRQATERARRALLKEAARKGRRVKPETLEAAAYTFLFTTLERHFPAGAVLELYRGRWQVEIAFKRLKSIMNLGHLKKTDPEGAQAWVHGKLLVAFLLEALIAAGDRFSPWGYPIAWGGSHALPVARDLDDAPPA